MSTLDIGTIMNRVTTQIARIAPILLFIPLLAIISIATPLSIT